MKHKKIFLIFFPIQVLVSSSFFNPNLLPKLAAIYNQSNVPASPKLPAGTLDLTFVQGVGYEVNPILSGTTDNILNDVAIDSKNRIIGVGQVKVAPYAQIVLVRYLPNGDIDTSFGDAGFVTYVMTEGADNYATAVVVDNEDRIIVAGTVDNEFALARFLVDGSLDDNFNGGQPVTAPGDNAATDLVMDSLGNFIIVGTNQNIGVSFLVARYTSDGTLDVTFGNGNGYFVSDVAGVSSCYGVALDSQNNIYACGSNYNGNVQLCVQKIYSDGSALDTSFGVDGIFKYPFAEEGDPVAYSIVIDSEGRIVGGGGGLNGYFLLFRLTPSGEFDTTFGTYSGYELYEFTGLIPYDQGPVKKVIIDPLGRIVMFGTQSVYGGGKGFVVARALQSGALDTTFGVDGACNTKLGLYENLCGSGCFDQQGKMIIVGSSDEHLDKFGIARFTTDYSLDYYEGQFAQQQLGLF